MDRFYNDVINGNALWKQSHLTTYHRYTTHFLVVHPLYVYQYVVSLASAFVIRENSRLFRE